MTLKKDTILIVDDTPSNLGIVFTQLTKAGYKVLVAENGKNALQRASIAQPDLILLDVMMPEMDGFETCRRLKANNETRHIPVIFMTALSDVANELTGLELGAVDYIAKPIKIDIVKARINTHLTLQKLQKKLQAQNQELQDKNRQLQEALDTVKTLNGLLPICAHCKKIRDDSGYWHQIEVYINEHSDADFSHGICPDCMVELYPEYK